MSDTAEPTRVSLLEQEGEIAADYLEELLEIADLDGDIDMDVEGDRATVSVVGADLPQLVGDNGEVLRAALPVGGGMTLPDGLGSITFDGWDRWVKLQVSDTPGNLLTLIAIAVGVAGLCVSLFVRPRRLFVRVTDAEATAGGLDRADAASGLPEEVAALLAATTGSQELRDNGEGSVPADKEEATA